MAKRLSLPVRIVYLAIAAVLVLIGIVILPIGVVWFVLAEVLTPAPRRCTEPKGDDSCPDL